MSNNSSESDFSYDFGKTIPINLSFFITPKNHRDGGLKTAVYEIGSICLNKQEFCIDGAWYRMLDYKFGAIEPSSVPIGVPERS